MFDFSEKSHAHTSPTVGTKPTKWGSNARKRGLVSHCVVASPVLSKPFRNTAVHRCPEVCSVHALASAVPTSAGGGVPVTTPVSRYRKHVISTHTLPSPAPTSTWRGGFPSVPLLVLLSQPNATCCWVLPMSLTPLASRSKCSAFG